MAETVIVRFDETYAPEIRRIRNRVFTREQHIDAALDFDGQDSDAVHVLVSFEGTYIGTGRLLPDGHIGRLAVLQEYRGRGLGTEAVRALIEEAENLGMKRVYLGAQKHAVGFYEKLGFSAYGEAYIEVDIEHIQMERYIQREG